MNINATLVGQMITFTLFVWVTMRFVWPPLEKALEERENTIASGLKAAELGEQKLKEASQQADQTLQEARQQAHLIVQEARETADRMVRTAKTEAQVEKQRILERAQDDIALAEQQARDALLNDVVNFAMAGAQKLVQTQLDASQAAHLVEQAMNECQHLQGEGA